MLGRKGKGRGGRGRERAATFEQGRDHTTPAKELRATKERADQWRGIYVILNRAQFLIFFGLGR